MMREYSELLELASELEMFRGYQSPEEEKREAEVRRSFDGARNKLVYALLREEPDADAASAIISTEIADLIEAQPEWSSTFEFIQEEIVARIHSESSKSPLVRNIFRWGPLGLGAAALIAYFIVRMVSAIEIDQPIESRAGIEQRAAAFHKAARYDDWMSGVTRRRWVMELLLWPIQPTDEEIKGSQELVGLTAEGFAALTANRIICGGPAEGTENQMSDAQIELVGKVADYVREPKTQWLDPPVMTVLEPLKASYPCR